MTAHKARRSFDYYVAQARNFRDHASAATGDYERGVYLSRAEHYERQASELLDQVLASCRCCHRDLHNPESVSAGIGPTCAGKR